MATGFGNMIYIPPNGSYRCDAVARGHRAKGSNGSDDAILSPPMNVRNLYLPFNKQPRPTALGRYYSFLFPVEILFTLATPMQLFLVDVARLCISEIMKKVL